MIRVFTEHEIKWIDQELSALPLFFFGEDTGELPPACRLGLPPRSPESLLPKKDRFLSLQLLNHREDDAADMRSVHFSAASVVSIS